MDLIPYVSEMQKKIMKFTDTASASIVKTKPYPFISFSLPSQTLIKKNPK